MFVRGVSSSVFWTPVVMWTRSSDYYMGNRGGGGGSLSGPGPCGARGMRAYVARGQWSAAHGVLTGGGGGWRGIGGETATATAPSSSEAITVYSR